MFQALKGWFSVSDESAPDSGPAENVEKTATEDSGGDKLSNVINLAKDWSSQVYHKVIHSGEEAVHMISDKANLAEVGSAVRGVVDKVPIFRDFQRLQDDFTAEQASKQVQSDSVLLPWHPDAAGVTDTSVLDKLRARVLELSKHPNTFLVSPPAEAHVDDEVFRSPDNVHLANALLDNDANLRDMRYKLVPNQIREDLFWRNYFYRLSIVRQSFQLSAMADSGSEEFVCVDQDSSWYQSTSDSTAQESSTPPAVQPITTSGRKQQQRPSSKRTSKRQSGGDQPQVSTKSQPDVAQRLTPDVPPASATTALLSGPTEGTTTTALKATQNPAATTTTNTRSSPAENTSEIDELTAEELLEAELASDLSAFDLAPSDDVQLDRELELEILAELEDQASPKQTE